MNDLIAEILPSAAFETVCRRPHAQKRFFLLGHRKSLLSPDSSEKRPRGIFQFWLSDRDVQDYSKEP